MGDGPRGRTAAGRVLLAAVLGASLSGPMAAGDNPSIEQLEQDVRQCAACHGADGLATQMPWNGRIAGQHYEYLVYILRQYRAGRVRGLNGSVMAGAVAHLDDARLKALARYYSTLD
jgi:cytochrome c553